MMELYIGGYKQGKLKYVLTKHPTREDKILNDFHLWIRKMMQSGMDVEYEVDRYLDKNPDALIICDEVGNGIVPVDPFERRYRETVGNVLIKVAARADRVERVTCGIGQRIK